MILKHWREQMLKFGLGDIAHDSINRILEGYIIGADLSVDLNNSPTFIYVIAIGISQTPNEIIDISKAKKINIYEIKKINAF